jgi:putative PEP-CTERM system TPR-repeat lipoprotein
MQFSLPIRGVARAAVLGVLMSTAVLGLAGCDQSSGDGSAGALARAQKDYDAGEVSAAVIELKNALQKDPKNADGRQLLGKILLRTGDPVAAERELSRAWDLGLQDDETRLLLAQARLAQGHYADVVNAVKVDQGTATPVARDLLAARGEALLGLGKIDEASKAFNDVLAEGPHAIAYAGEARVALIRGDQTRARAMLDEALALAPDDPQIGMLDADWLYQEGRYQDAAARFHEVVKADPRNLMARLGEVRAFLAGGDVKQAQNLIEPIMKARSDDLAVVFEDSLVQYTAGNYQRAKADAERILASNEQQETALRIAGSSAYQLGDLEQTLARLSQYLAIRPDDNEARKMFAATQLRQNNPEGAKSTLRPLMDKPLDSMDDPMLLTLIGSASAQSGDLENAIKYFNRASVLVPKDAKVRQQIADLYIAAGDTVNGEAGFKQALALESDNENDPALDKTLRALILSLINQQKYDEAIEKAKLLQEREPNSTAGYVLAGTALIAKGDVTGARAAFNKALEVKPGAADAASNLAMLDLQEGRIDSARDHLKSVLELDPGHLRTLLLLAELELQTGNPEARQKWLEQADDKNPQSVEARILLARHYLAVGKADRAVAVAAPAMQDNPKNAALTEVLGRAQLATDPAAAVATLTQWSTLRPNSGEPLYLLARAKLSQGDLVGAKAAAEKAIEVEPKHQAARLTLIEVLLANKEMDQARQQLGTLQKDAPDNPMVMEMAGRVEMLDGRPQDAVGHLTQARQKLDIPEINRELARAQWLANDHAAAMKTLEDWVGRNPGDAQSQILLAGFYDQSARPDDAKKAYEAVIQSQPDNWAALNDLSWLLYRQGDAKAALPYAQKAYGIQPKNADVADTLGVVLLAGGDASRAVSVLGDAAGAQPKRQDIGYHYAQALAAAKRPEDARKVLESVLSNDQKFDQRADAEALLSKLNN